MATRAVGKAPTLGTWPELFPGLLRAWRRRPRLCPSVHLHSSRSRSASSQAVTDSACPPIAASCPVCPPVLWLRPPPDLWAWSLGGWRRLTLRHGTREEEMFWREDAKIRLCRRCLRCEHLDLRVRSARCAPHSRQGLPHAPSLSEHVWSSAVSQKQSKLL